MYNKFMLNSLLLASEFTTKLIGGLSGLVVACIVIFVIWLSIKKKPNNDYSVYAKEEEERQAKKEKKKAKKNAKDNVNNVVDEDNVDSNNANNESNNDDDK